ncbi:MAG: hypothetical protein K5695_14020 [Oscillospiraceae bacterium]|nr:hypothetical protein [Oscillospiraceae bacterium]
MKRKIIALLAALLCFTFTPVTAFAAETEPFIIETDTFQYYSTASREDKLSVKGTDANLMVTAIYQNKEDPTDKLYTAVELHEYYAGRIYLMNWEHLPDWETVQVGDLIYVTPYEVVETYPGRCYLTDVTSFKNYGNGSAVLGDEFKEVIRNELEISQSELMKKEYEIAVENYRLLSVPPEVTGEAPQQLYGDFNHDGEVNASDAAIMLIYAAEHGAGTFSGSFEEYVSK